MDRSSVSDAWHPPVHYENEMHWISACQFPSAMKEPCYCKTKRTVITTTIRASNTVLLCCRYTEWPHLTFSSLKLNVCSCMTTEK